MAVSWDICKANEAKGVGAFDALSSACWSFTEALAWADQFVAVQGVPYGPQLGVAAELAMLEVLAGGWIKDREVSLGEEG